MDTRHGVLVRYLQELRVFPAKLLQKSWKHGGVLLDSLPHVKKLGLSPQECKGVLP